MSSSQLSKQLYDACYRKKERKVIALLKQGADPNSEEGETGTTPLHYACQYGWLDIAQQLIEEYKCDPETRTPARYFQMTPLHCACQFGQRKIAKLLIENFKCDPNVRDTEGMTPLHYACRYQQLGVVKLLASMDDCDLNVADKDEKTPLHYACDCNHTGIISELVQHGADPNFVNRENGLTPLVLHYVCKNGDVEIANLLVEKFQYNPNDTDTRGMTPLHYACHYGKDQVASLLIKKFQCNPKCRDTQGMTPLHYACRYEQLAVVRLLVNVDGCEINAKDTDEWTPLHYACECNHTDIISELVQRGADPNFINCDGDTPLHKLICHKLRSNNADILPSLECLLEAPICNPNIKNKSGLTPLLLWWTNNLLDESKHDIQMLRVFLALGADPSVSDSTLNFSRNGLTPLHYVCKYGDVDIANLLIETFQCNPSDRDTRGVTPLHYACHYGRNEIAKLLIEKFQCNPNDRDTQQLTPLHYACQHKQHEIVMVLATMDVCELNAKDTDEWTPLHYACKYNHLGIISELVQHGADPNVVNRDGDTPLHRVMHHKQRSNNVDIILPSLKCLLEAPNCNPNIKNKSGLTPLLLWWTTNLDESKHDIEMLRVFLALGAHPNVSDSAIKNKNGLSPLHYVCKYGEVEIANLLVDQCNPSDRDTWGMTPLHYACRYGRNEIAKLLIEKFQCNPNDRDTQQMTPLHYACHHKQLEVVKLLVSMDVCELNAKDEDEWTPLHYACANNHTGIINELVQHGADPNLVNRDGDTPLHRVMHHKQRSNNVDIILPSLKCLLEAPNCNPNIKNKSCLTPLQLLLGWNHAERKYLEIEILRELLAHGADPNITDSEGNTLLHRACTHGDQDVVNLLLQTANCDSNITNKSGRAPLHCACQYGWNEIAKLLIEKFKFNPNVRDSQQLTPLHYACQHKQHEIVKLLATIYLDVCEINAKDEDEWTPLHYACECNDTGIISELVQHGADPNLVDLDGDTPLHKLIYHKQRSDRVDILPSLKCLWEAPNCNPNIKNKSGLTPLLLGWNQAEHKHLEIEILREFLAHGADPNITDERGNTLLHKACTYTHGDQDTHAGIISELVQHGADPNLVNRGGDTPLHRLMRNKHGSTNVDILPSLKCLLEAPNCNPNIKNKSGLTPLLLGWNHAEHTYLEIVILRELLARGTDPNITDERGNTLLHKVCTYTHGDQGTHTAIISELVQHGADPNLVNRDGDTPLHRVMSNKRGSNNVDIILPRLKCLLEAPNCNPNINNKSGLTPLLLGWNHAEHKYLEIEIPRELLAHGADPNITDSEGNTLLHRACTHGDQDVVNLLLQTTNCDSNITNKSGRAPLHYACQYGWNEIAKLLIEKFKCNPNVRDSNQMTPLHYAGQYGRNAIAKLLISEYHCNSYVRDSMQRTPLHYACRYGRDETTHLLIELFECNPNVRDWRSMTPLHYACQYGHETLVKLLINMEECALNATDKDGETPLHIACGNNHTGIISELVQHGAGPNLMDSEGDTPLHKLIYHKKRFVQVQKSLNDIVYIMGNLKCLLEAPNCDPNISNKQGLTPLLTSQSQTNVMRELIAHGANPNVLDNDGSTLLHNACQDNDSIQVKFLLESPNIDPNTKNKNGMSPLQVTTDTRIIRELIRHGANAKDVYKIYGRPLKRPLQPPVKVCIVGNPSVGKSTLTAALKKENSFFARTFATAQKVTGVDERTAGVVPHEFESKLYGYTTLYDFAGQREFYGSHSALLQNVIQTSPPVFLIVVDLCESEEEITQTVLYWLTFLENQCASVSDKPHVIIVGSHADVLRARGEDPKLKITFLKLNTTISLSKFVFAGFIAMDCQYAESPGMDKIRKCLKSSCKALRPKKTISFNAHCFYAYLVDKFTDTVAVTVEQIQAQITREDTSPGEHNLMRFIPGSLLQLCKICDELNDRGHVLFLKDLEAIEQSWVVIDKECLLAQVSGSIFAPEQFKQHKTITQCACSTGVVPLSSIANKFPNHNSEMLIKFLSCLEFCHEISDPEILHRITAEHQTCMVSGPSHSPRERYFLFPALVSLSVPAHVWDDKPEYTHHCGWILCCSTEKPEQFFTSRFLQVVVLRTAFSFPLSEGDTLQSNPAIQRNCSIWKNGIFWGDASGVETLVEVVPDNKAIIVMMRCDNNAGLTNLVQLRSQVICKVLQAKNEFCSAIDAVESFIDPSETTQYPLKPASQLKLFGMSNISRAVLDTNYPSARVVSPTGTIPPERLVPFEPYAGLGEDILWEMFEERDQDTEKIPDSFLSRIAPIMAKNSDLFIKIFTPEHEAHSTATACDILSVLKAWRAGCAGTYKSLREKLDEFSVFAGRNPLALAGVTERKQRPKQKTAQCELPESSTQDDDEQNERESPVLEPTTESMKRSDVPKLRDLVVVLKAVDWYSLGLQLDISSTDLNEIDDQYPQRKIDRKRSDMFDLWLANEPDPSWEKIVTALERVGGHIGIIRTIQSDHLKNTTQDNHATDGGQSEMVLTQDTEQYYEHEE